MGLLRYTERVDADSAAAVHDSATLPFDKRCKTRLRVALDRSGIEVGLVLPRGSVLRGGDLLRASDASIIRVIAAVEAVSTVSGETPGALARAAYHLGNRHLPVQIGAGWVRYLSDHVIDEMLAAMGFAVAHQHAPFEAEGGAYDSAHAHAHTHPAGERTHRHDYG